MEKSTSTAITASGCCTRIRYGCQTPSAARGLRANIAKKMSRFGNVILDGSIGDSFIARGIHVRTIEPCVDLMPGPSLQSESRSPLHHRGKPHRLGHGYSGGTGFSHPLRQQWRIGGHCRSRKQRKNLDMDTFYCVSQDKRIVTIEDTRELSLAQFDENGVMVNDVIHLLTKKNNPRHQLDLFEAPAASSRLVPAEMRQKR